MSAARTRDAGALTAYLTARLDEDEEAASFALDIASRYGDDYDTEWQWVLLSKPKRRQHGWSSTSHPGAPAPAAVLADIAAKRAIMALHRASDQDLPGQPNCAACGGPDSPWTAEWPCPTLYALAQPYAARDDFPTEWKADA